MHKKIPLLALPLILALAGPVQANDDKALLAKCDIDRNGDINTPANNLPPQDWATIEQEQVCQHEFELDQLAKDIPDIRKRCDLNGNGRIDHELPLVAPVMMTGKETNARQAWRNLPEEVRKPVDAEKKCVMDASIAQKDASIAKGKAEIAELDAESKRFDEIIALLPREDVKRALNLELTKTEQQLRSTNAPDQRKKLQVRLQIIKEQLAKLK